MSDIVIGASEIEGFQPQGIGADIALTGVIVTLNSTAVTGTNFLPQSVVGLSGFKISLGTPAVTYTVASVESRSALTLATQYLASSGTVTGTLHKLAHLRVYVLNAFTPSGESFVAQSGSPGSTAWFRRYGVSVISDGAQNVAHVPQITLPATTDSNVPTARYFAGIYTQGGAFIQAYPGCVDEWQLDADTTPTSWAEICNFNTPAPPTPNLSPDDFVTESELNARLPNGTQDQLVYFAATGNVLSPLNVGSGLAISGGALAVTSALNRVQEEGANLPQQATINFIGSSFTAADDAGNSRTNVTADADLNALASTATTGLYNRTGDGTSNTITTSAGLAGVISDETGSGALVFGTSPTIATPTITTPTITGGTHTAITGLGIRSTGGGAFDLQIVNTETLAANRALTFTLNDAARTVNLGGNLTLANSFTTAGAFALTLTQTGATNVTLPTTGTLATLAGAETLTNKIVKGYPLTLEVNATATGNVGAGLDALHSFTLVADTLAANLDYVEAEYTGSFATNDADKRLVLQLDGQILFDSGLQDFDGAADRNGWILKVTVVRVSATTVNAMTQVMIGQFFADGAGTFVSTNGMARANIATAVTVSNLDSTAVAIRVLGEATSNDDIVARTSVVKVVQR